MLRALTLIPLGILVGLIGVGFCVTIVGAPVGIGLMFLGGLLILTGAGYRQNKETHKWEYVGRHGSGI